MALRLYKFELYWNMLIMRRIVKLYTGLENGGIMAMQAQGQCIICHRKGPQAFSNQGMGTTNLSLAVASNKL